MRFSHTVALCLLLLYNVSAHPRRVVPVLEIDPAVRAFLSAAWDDVDPYQRERAYCAGLTTIHWSSGEITYRLDRIERAGEVFATPYSVFIDCSMAKSPYIILHIHPPTSCHLSLMQTLVCEMGGRDANDWSPSGNDVINLIRAGMSVGVIQFARDSYTLYYVP